MDQTRLLALIGEGENDNVDFKRELRLDTARDKAEFVKDVVSLANSQHDIGYLLIGVDDSKYIVGCDSLEEERIQQIVHKYIDPPVRLRCFLVSISASGFPSVGIVEIQATNRPHRVRRDIDRLQQDEVYVRRGSVVTKATPEEIIRMHSSETGLTREAREYVQAAEMHIKLGNLEQAYQAYSAAILLTPKPELFVARAKVLEQHRSRGIHSRLESAKLSLALKDYSNALSFTVGFDLEQEIRTGRLRLSGLWDFDQEGDLSYTLEYVEGEWIDDVQWLEEHAIGLHRGEFLCLKQKARWAASSYYEDGWLREETLHELAEALQLGYRTAEVHHFRALAHHFSENHGLALQELALALDIAEDPDAIADCLRLRAGVLLVIRRYREAHEDLQRAGGWAGQDWLGCESLDQMADEIIYRIGMGWKFGKLSKESLESDFRSILTILLLSKTRPLFFGSGGKRVPIARPTFEKLYPMVASEIRSIVGEQPWRASRTQDATYSVRITFS